MIHITCRLSISICLSIQPSFHPSVTSRFDAAALHADLASVVAPALVLVTTGGGGLRYWSGVLAVRFRGFSDDDEDDEMITIGHCSLFTYTSSSSSLPLSLSSFCLSRSLFLLNTLYRSLSHWEIISTGSNPRHSLSTHAQ